MAEQDVTVQARLSHGCGKCGKTGIVYRDRTRVRVG